MADLPSIAEVGAADAATLDRLLREATAPFVVRGLVRDWPLVQAAKQSSQAAREYLVRHHRDVPFTVSIGRPGGGDRLFYDDAMAMNFATVRAKLPDILDQVAREEDSADPRPIYLASIDIRGFFEGLDEANRVDLGTREPLASIWIGTRTRIAAHNDLPANLACVAAGRRRFTLFPPDQFANLHLGPLDNTPAGRAVSMVDFSAPDQNRHPRFAEALRHGQVAELGPGDAIHIPSLWWHHVEGLEPFNILVNYWWRDQPRWLGQPQDALHHAILAIRDLPDDQKAHWRAVFDHYVFTNDDAVTAHIPEGGRGVLDPLTAESAGRLRNFLLRQLAK